MRALHIPSLRFIRRKVLAANSVGFTPEVEISRIIIEFGDASKNFSMLPPHAKNYLSFPRLDMVGQPCHQNPSNMLEYLPAIRTKKRPKPTEVTTYDGVTMCDTPYIPHHTADICKQADSLERWLEV
jgi:hypothetical protein